MKRKVIDIETAKVQLIRINGILPKPHLLIGGLAVQRYVVTRDSKDIDLVCDHKVAVSLLKNLYPSDDWKVEEIHDNSFRPSYRITHRIQDSGEILFGPKIIEREPYKFLDWDFLLNNGNPIKLANKEYPNIIIPSCSHLAFSKLISFLSRNRALVDKKKQDLEDLTDLSNSASFNLKEFTSICKRSGAEAYVRDFISSLDEEEGTIFDRSAIGDMKEIFGMKYEPKLHSSKSRPTRTRQSSPLREQTKINPYKLFYYRVQNNKSIKQLSSETKIKAQKLRRFESMKNSANAFSENVFSICSINDILILEQFLKCKNCLEIGNEDDFSSLYMDYYYNQKHIDRKISISKGSKNKLIYHKVVVFDFDGTLTVRTEDITTWERIWVKLGYTINDCAGYFVQYMQRKITHERWCEITREKFIEKGLNLNILDEVAKDINLLGGVKETLQLLREKGFKLYILSGSIKQLITRVLGNLVDLIDDIRANDLVFNKQGNLIEIVGTKHDFEGKAVYLKQIIKDNNISPQEVLFVGNSINDVYASQSGVETLCVNPRLTNPTNLKEWHNCIRKMNNLEQILEFVKYPAPK